MDMITTESLAYTLRKNIISFNTISVFSISGHSHKCSGFRPGCDEVYITMGFSNDRQN
jgi:hypothetical protein